MKPILLIVCLITGIHAPAWGAEPISIPNWMVLGPFLAAPRDGGIDHLLDFGGEKRIVPSKDQLFYSPLTPNGTLQWREIKGQTEEITLKHERIDWDSIYERFGSIGLLNVSYAYSEVKVERDTRALVWSKKVPVFVLNGKGYLGEPYSKTFNHTPILLRQGVNRILLKVAGKLDHSFTFRMTPLQEQAVLLDDFTVPDLLATQLVQDILIGVAFLNTTENWLDNLSIATGATHAFKASSTPVRPVAPFSVVKVPIQLVANKNVTLSSDNKSHSLQVQLFRSEDELARKPVNLSVKSTKEARKITFLSEIDNSVQYFSVFHPTNHDPSKQYPVIFSLHGAGVEAEWMSDQYSSKEWAFLVFPTNRRPFGSDWQDWGRLDFLEVMEQVKQRYNVDQERFYLTGHSMGGQGVWHIGLHYPSLFAAIAPLAGWTNFQIYSPFTFQKSRMLTDPNLLLSRQRAMLDSNNLYFLPNAQHLPIIVTHGEKDKVVPPTHPRLYQEILNQLGFKVLYREIAGKPHWWREPLVKGKGADVVENDEIMQFLKRQRLQRFPKTLKVRLYDLTVNDQYYWVKVLKQTQVMRDTTVEANVDGNSIVLETKNIDALEINADRQLIDFDNITVVWNGGSHKFDLKTGQRRLKLAREGKSLANAKSANSLKSVFFSPFVIVYGTRGTKQTTDDLLHGARLIAAKFWRVANGRTRILRDVDVDETIIRDFNLVLLGSGQSNALTNRILGRLPMTVGKGQLQFQGRTHTGDKAIVLLHPNPLNPDKLIALFAGTTPRSELLSLYFLPLYSGSSTPDYIIFNDSVRKYVWGGVEDAGFFSNQWTIE